MIDISNPAEPRLVGRYDDGHWGFGVAVSGHHAYWAVGSGLRVLDISNPADPQPVGDAEMVAVSVAVSGSYAYLPHSGGLSVVDVSDPTNPLPVGETSGFSGGDVAVSGNSVYVAAGDGLVILERFHPPPRFEASRFDATGFHLSFQGEAGQAVRLQWSQDLKTWVDWVILPGTGSLQEVVDPTALTHSSQFYRAATP